MRNPILRASFELLPGELLIDSFAGGGGASEGIARAMGRPVDIAVNHDPVAIAMHKANHPETHHLCESVWEVDPRAVCGSRPVGIAWFSPDCKHFSRAKGNTPVEKGIRGLAWVVVRWAREVQPRILVVENVEEFQTWGPLGPDGRPDPARAGETFRAWRAELIALGYQVEFTSLIAADYGTPTTRKRLFLVARRDRKPIVWPAPTHGKGRAMPWRPAAEIIDWRLPVPSIFDRARPLAEATLRRIAVGVRRYVLESASPFIVPVTHQGDLRVHGVGDPLRTVTAANRGELALVAPSIVKFHGGDRGHTRGQSIDETLRTLDTSNRFALIAPTLIQTGYGERKGQTPRTLDLGVPLGTVVAGGQKHGLVTAFLSKHYGGVIGHGLEKTIGTVTSIDHHALSAVFLSKLYGTSTGSDAGLPLPTVTAGGGKGGGHLAAVQAFLVKYYGAEGQSQTQGLDVPLHTATTKARFGLVTIHGEDYAIADIGMRMLQPPELFAAQGFPEDYDITPDYNGKPLTKTMQIALAGNSVCVDVAEALVFENARAG